MAKMSLQEKLAAAKAGGPAPAAPAPESEPVAEPDPAQEAAAAPPPPAPAPRPPQPTGKKLSMKEKLAAAKAGGPAVESAAPEPEAEAAPEPEAAPDAPAPAPAPVAAAPSEPGKKLSLKEKLAAAKGGAAPAAAGAPSAKPATAAAKPAAAAASRALPPLDKATDPRDLAEHLRRAGAEKEKTAKAAAAAKSEAAKPAAPPGKKVAEAKVVPPRPGREAALTEATGGNRREFLSASAVVAVIVAGWAAFTAAMSAMGLGTLRFMFPNVLAEPPSTIKVGLPSNFEPGTVNETWKAEWGFWLVRSPVYSGADAVYALSSICTHLGCPPNWLVGEQKFKCPCHGSGFYISGVNFEGPAPRPLERYKVSVGDDGQVVVDKSQKFQEELGQWTDPDSFIPMA